MEGGKGSCSSSCSSSSSSRWNPTKEQISILEGIYKQGIRTPSAEQIQQITGKLREYGNIEGKNVFYWFQNHKARQRQKQKQESFAYFSRLLHRAPPPPPILAVPPPAAAALPPGILPPPQAYTNVCSPYYLPAPQVGGGVGFYQPQFPTVFLPGALKTRPDMGLIQRNIGTTTEAIEEANNYNNKPSDDATGILTCDEADKNGSIYHETLQLFPLHPTGIMEEIRSGGGTPAMSASPESERVEDGDEDHKGSENQPFFNFLGAPRGQC